MRSRLRRCTELAVATVACALTLAAPVAPARAQGDAGVADDVDAYRAAVQAGAAAFDAGDFPAARDAFERAWRIHAEPVLLFNIASTFRREGDYEAAIGAYRRFLEVAPEDHPDVPLARETVSHLEIIVRERREAAREAAAARAAASRERAGGARALAEPTATGEPAAGGPAAVREPAAAQRRESVLLPRAHRRPSSATLQWTGIAVAAAGSAGLGLAVLERVHAQEIADELANLPAGTKWDSAQAERLAEGEAAERRSLRFAIGGGALLVAGVTLAVVGATEDRDDRVVVAPRVGPGELGVAVSGAF